MQRLCDFCEQPYEAKTARSQYCSDNHRVQASIRRRRDGVQLGKAIAARPAEGRAAIVQLLTSAGIGFDMPEGPPQPEISPLLVATERELTELGKLDTVEGRTALELAAKVSSKIENGSQVASASRRLLDIMVGLRNEAKELSADPVTDIMSMRDRKRHAG